QFRADNIRKVRSKTGVYPSPLHVEATIVDTATMRVDGDADFFAGPTAAIKAAFDLRGLRLDYLEPILHHYDLTVRSGTLTTRGEVEYAPTVKTARLSEVSLDLVDLDYVKARADQPTASEKATHAAAAATQQPSVAVHADRIRIVDSALAYRNETTDPPYRLCVSNCNITLNGFSNVIAAPDASPGKAVVQAKFMGSGDTHVDASFRPLRDRTDFDVSLRIDDTLPRPEDPRGEQRARGAGPEDLRGHRRRRGEDPHQPAPRPDRDQDGSLRPARRPAPRNPPDRGQPRPQRVLQGDPPRSRARRPRRLTAG